MRIQKLSISEVVSKAEILAAAEAGRKDPLVVVRGMAAGATDKTFPGDISRTVPVFTGFFEIESRLTGKRLTGGKMYLPEIVAGPLAAEIRKATLDPQRKGSTVNFSFGFLPIKKANPAGFEWVADSLLDDSAKADPFAALREAEQLQLQLPAAETKNNKKK